jgi:hypothetical protein
MTKYESRHCGLDPQSPSRQSQNAQYRDSGLRGNDEVEGAACWGFVIPVEAGIHVFSIAKYGFQAAKSA